MDHKLWYREPIGTGREKGRIFLCSVTCLDLLLLFIFYEVIIFEQTCKVSKRTSFEIPPSFSRFVSSDSSSYHASEKSDT